MRERTKDRIKKLIAGSFLLFIGSYEWLLVASQGYKVHSLLGLVEVDRTLFYLFHIGAIVLGALVIIEALIPGKYTLRFCPTCQRETEQFVFKIRFSDKIREWTCESCRKKNSEPWITATKK